MVVVMLNHGDGDA